MFLVAEYAGVGAATLFAFAWAYRLTSFDLSRPFSSFVSDGILSLYTARMLGEGHLFVNPRVGAPFGLAYYDFYQPDYVHQAMLWVLERLAGNPMVAVNAFYILGYLLISGSAYYVLRRFSVSRVISAICAILFAFTPSHLLRGEAHLFLSSYWIVPWVVLLVLQIMDGRMWPRPGRRGGPGGEGQPGRGERPSRSFVVWALGLSVVAGGSGVYYCFFSLIFLAVSGAVALLMRRDWRCAGLAASCLSVSLACLLIALTPVIHYNAQNGRNPTVAARDVGQTDVLSLKIADLFLPGFAHPIPAFRNLTQRYLSSDPALLGNESQFAALGAVAAAGCLVLLVAVLVGFPGRPVLLQRLGVLNLAGLLAGTTAGFGTLFALVVTPELRCLNRISFFLAFFSLSAVAICLEYLRRRFSRVRGGWLAVAAICLVAAGLYDEAPGGLVETRKAAGAEYDASREFVSRVEDAIPARSAVLQLPFQSFPEAAPVFRMTGYDHLRGYVLSSTLRWSYPVMRGRYGTDWMGWLCTRPAHDLLVEALEAGFAGLYIDRWGYADQAASLEGQLRAELQMSPMVSSDRRFAFYDIAKAPPRLLEAAHRTIVPLPVSFLPDFYDLEVADGKEWRWCNRHGEIAIANGKPLPVRARLSLRAVSGYPTPSRLTIKTASGATRFPITAAGTPISLEMLLKPGATFVYFSTDAPRVQTAPTDIRELHFRVEDVAVTPE